MCRCILPPIQSKNHLLAKQKPILFKNLPEEFLNQVLYDERFTFFPPYIPPSFEQISIITAVARGTPQILTSIQKKKSKRKSLKEKKKSERKKKCCLLLLFLGEEFSCDGSVHTLTPLHQEGCLLIPTHNNEKVY